MTIMQKFLTEIYKSHQGVILLREHSQHDSSAEDIVLDQLPTLQRLGIKYICVEQTAQTIQNLAENRHWMASSYPHEHMPIRYIRLAQLLIKAPSYGITVIGVDMDVQKGDRSRMTKKQIDQEITKNYEIRNKFMQAQIKEKVKDSRYVQIVGALHADLKTPHTATCLLLVKNTLNVYAKFTNEFTQETQTFLRKNEIKMQKAGFEDPNEIKRSIDSLRNIIPKVDYVITVPPNFSSPVSWKPYLLAGLAGLCGYLAWQTMF